MTYLYDNEKNIKYSSWHVCDYYDGIMKLHFFHTYTTLTVRNFNHT